MTSKNQKCESVVTTTTTTVIETTHVCQPDSKASSGEKSMGDKIFERVVVSTIAAALTGGATIGTI